MCFTSWLQGMAGVHLEKRSLAERTNAENVAPWFIQAALPLPPCPTPPKHCHRLHIHVSSLVRTFLSSLASHMLLVLGQHRMLLLLLSEDVLLREKRLLLTSHWLLLSQQGLLLRCQHSAIC